jgi:2'-5' RNA ligase
MEKTLYFIALLPNDKISDEITAFKNEAKTRFDSKHALKSPPHITMIPPFRVYDNELEQVIKTINVFSKKQFIFNIELFNFNHFGKFVIYIDVIENKSLQEFHKDLNQTMEIEFQIIDKFKDRPFSPHLTIAFKDLKQSIYPMAWEYFSNINYERHFEANHLALLKHENKKWQIIQRFPFQHKI